MLTTLVSPQVSSAPAEDGRTVSPDTIMASPEPTSAHEPSDNSNAESVVMPMSALYTSGGVSAQSVFAVAALAVAAACILLLHLR